MKHVFVFDPKAFAGQEWKIDQMLDTLGQFFRTQENPDFSIHYSRYRRHAIGIINNEAEKAASGETVRVYAVGGDEILFDCLNSAIYFPNIQLAMIPYGASNDFLKIFGESNVEIFRNITAAVTSEAIPTDVMRWGVNYALNSCYIGMNSAVSQRTMRIGSNLGRRSFLLFSKFLFFINSILLSFNKQIARKAYKITIDDDDYSGNYSIIHIANGPYYAGRITGAKFATPNDGLLDVSLIKSSNPIGTLLSMRKYSRGEKPKNCIFLQAQKITVESDNQMWIQFDTEYIQDTSVHINVVHRAVNFISASNLSYPIASITAF